MLYASVCSTDNFPRSVYIVKRRWENILRERQASFFWGVQNVLEMSQLKFKLWSFYENWNLCSLMALQRSTRTFFRCWRSFWHWHKSSLRPDMFELLFDNLIFPLPRVRECIEFEFTNYGFNITREREIRRLCHFNLLLPPLALLNCQNTT